MSKNSIFILAAIIICGIFFTLDEFSYEPVSDELLYRFKLGEYPLGDENYSEHLSSFKDVLTSQYHQYFYSNGRFIVHVFVQTFAGLMPRSVYAIVNALVLLATIVMLMNYTFTKRSNLSSPLLWIIAILAYFYAFPGYINLFISIPGALNYLWPMTLVLGFLLCQRHISRRDNIKTGSLILLCIYGFITGWSQECFALPLSAAVFFYSIIRFKALRKTEILMALALFAGTAILTFAPGNFVRLGATGRTGISGYITSFICAVKLFLQIKVIWLLLLLIIISIIRKKSVKGFIKENLLTSLCLLFSILLGCVANTLPQSFTGIEFFSLIIIFRIIDSTNINFSKPSYNLTAGLLLILFIIHQAFIVTGRQAMVNIHRKIVADYIESSTGVLQKPETSMNPIIRPFVPDWTLSIVPEWTNYTISAYYGNKEKALVMLSPDDYDITMHPQEKIAAASHHVSGSLKCIETDSGYWGYLPATDSIKNILIRMYPQTLDDNPTWFTKLKFIYRGQEGSDSIIKPVNEYFLISTNDSLVVRVNKPLNRRVKSIDITADKNAK